MRENLHHLLKLALKPSSAYSSRPLQAQGFMIDREKAYLLPRRSQSSAIASTPFHKLRST